MNIVEFNSKEVSKKKHPKRDITVYILRKAGLGHDITGVQRGIGTRTRTVKRNSKSTEYS